VTGIKVEIALPADETVGILDFAFYHRQPDVGWVFDSMLAEVTVGSIADDVGDELTALYPENDPPA